MKVLCSSRFTSAVTLSACRSAVPTSLACFVVLDQADEGACTFGDEAGVLVEELEEIALARQKFAEKHAGASRFVEEFTGRVRRTLAGRRSRGRPPLTMAPGRKSSLIDPSTPSREMAAAAAPSNQREPLHLSVRGLACRRGERNLFAALGFVVHAGEIVWLRGANGQGKTTLLRTLAGLSAPDEGTIVWDKATAARPFLYIAHANALKEDLSATESLHFLMGLSGQRPLPGEIDAALDRFAMAGRRHALVRTLSQGQRRRVALARLAVARAPATWLLDEPFDALDAAGIDTLDALLCEHARRGGSTVLTSHVALTIDDPIPLEVMLESPVAA
jgi:heme exporter protein A